jgi:hypothetical protein
MICHRGRDAAENPFWRRHWKNEAAGDPDRPD